MEYINKKWGWILPIVLGFILIYVFFGNILQSPNYVFFANGGDGLKSTFSAYYHIQYDSSYAHTISQNYPYGESMYYTGGQAVIANPLKWLKQKGIDWTPYLTAIINVWMLLSFVVAMLLLYMLLVRLKLPPWYSLVVATIIVFMGPQLDRFGGHYNLAYMYFLPLMMYSLYVFYKKPGLWSSLFIALVAVLSVFTHPYFFTFLALWSAVFMLYMYLSRQENFSYVLKLALWFAIQIILPFVIYKLILGDVADDRSASPWGFRYSRACPETIFLPLEKPYGHFIHIPWAKWEGTAYIGLVAVISFAMMLWQGVRRLLQQGKGIKWWRVSGHVFLDALFWGAILALLLSFAYPFAFGLWDLWKYTGPFRQLRAVGRYSWLFYFLINVMVYYMLWWWYKRKNTRWALVVLVAALLWGGYDAYTNVSKREQMYNNTIEALADTDNASPANAWVQHINPKDYQAILPLPYYHVGSELYWIGEHDGMLKSSFIASWKTGLPLMSVMLSRTSLGQTIKSLALYMAPNKPLAILHDLPNKKDILLMLGNKDNMNEHEIRLLQYAHKLMDTPGFALYRLPVAAIEKMQADYVQRVVEQSTDTALFAWQDYRVSDSSLPVVAKDTAFVWHKDRFATVAHPSEMSELFSYTATTDFPPSLLSFSFADCDKDMIARANTELIIKGADGQNKHYAYSDVFKAVTAIGADGVGTVVIKVPNFAKGDTVVLRLKNKYITSEKIAYGNMILRAKTLDIYAHKSGYYMKDGVVVERK